MVWGEGLPSGRERAIETLIDMEPQSAFYRAARVLDEVVPQALANRPNLVTKPALIEQAHALAEHEIDSLSKYDALFSLSEQRSGTANSSTPSSLNATMKERILRHHAKLTNVQQQRRAGSTNALVQGTSGSSGNSGSTAPSATTTTCCTPSPQLVASLRHVYGGTEEDPPTFLFRDLLKAVMNHSVLADPSAIDNTPLSTTTTTSSTTTNLTKINTQLFSSPSPLLEDRKEQQDEEASTTSVESRTVGSSHVQLESLIANVCRLVPLSSNNNDSSADQQHYTNVLQGLLITVLSVITQGPHRGNNNQHDDNNNSSSHKGRSSKQSAPVSTTPTEDFPMLPTALQVGAVLHLLETATNNDSRDYFSLDSDILAYFGQAAAVYEGRIEIQKARLLARLQQQAEEKEREREAAAAATAATVALSASKADPPPPPPPPAHLTATTSSSGESPTRTPMPLTPTEGAFDSFPGIINSDTRQARGLIRLGVGSEIDIYTNNVSNTNNRGLDDPSGSDAGSNVVNIGETTDIDAVSDAIANAISDAVASASAAAADAASGVNRRQGPVERLAEALTQPALDSAAVLEQIISSAATGDETSSSNAEEENVSSESESDNSDENDDNDDSDTMEGYEEIGAGEVVGHDVVHDDQDGSGPAEDNQEDSSSSSSSAHDDAAMMGDDRAIESEVEQEEDDAVLRQALALSLAEQNRSDVTTQDGNSAETLLQVQTIQAHEQTQEVLDMGGTETPASRRSSKPSSDVDCSTDAPKPNTKETDDSSLPPLPPHPAFYPYASAVSGHQGEIDESELGAENMTALYFDPSALDKFGSLPTSHVLVHLLRYIVMMTEHQKFKSKGVDRPGDESVPNSVPRGMGCSLFGSEQAFVRSEGGASGQVDTADGQGIATSLQLLVACFLLIMDKRKDSIENLRKAVAREQRTVQGEDFEDDDVDKARGGTTGGVAPLSSEEEDDPAIALAMNYVEDEIGESSESLEAKGMRRKAKAAAYDAAALIKSLKRRTDAWKHSVKLYSQCAVYAMRSIRLFMQAIVRQWLLDRDSSSKNLSAVDCREFLPSVVGSKLSVSLTSLTSLAECRSYATLFTGNDESELGELFMPLRLYKEAMVTWVECVPLVYSSATSQVEILRSLMYECSSKAVSETHFRPLDSLSVLPSSDVEPALHRLQILCKRLRVSDLLDGFVSNPVCFVPLEKTRSSVDEVLTESSKKEKTSKGPICASSIVSLIGSSLRGVVGAKGDLQRLYLAICHRCHVRVLLWDGLFECAEVDADDVAGAVAPPTTITPSDLVRVNANPSTILQFDATKCSDSIAILSGHGDSSSVVNGSSVHQRASKVWGTVLSTHHYSPKTGVHRWAVRLDKCERGHVFVGVATAQASMRTYVGGDKFGWGMIGTQALWHDRRKIRGDYGATFRTGSTIIVTLDTDAGTLSFSSWKDTNTSTSFSLDPMLQNQSAPRRHGHIVGTIEEWGVAFEGLPLDSRLYPAVGLYQRDDRVTLLTVETGGRSVSRDGVIDVSGGLSYYPRMDTIEDKVHKERVHHVRRFNEMLSADGVQYVVETVKQIIECFQQGEDEFLLTTLLPCLAAALCLVPPSVPVLSERFALNILPHVTKAVMELERSRGERQMVHRLFRSGMRDGKWVIRATGSSGASSDYEEYVVDFSASTNEQGTVIGFQGTGVGTTGKSKNGLVAIFGTVKGSSIHFVEEWSDGAEDGFGTSSHDETSSCVVAARMSLDGNKFEGTYRNVQFGTTGQIAGMLCSETAPLSKFRLKDAPAYSKQSAELAGAVVAGEAILCLAHSHLAITIGEDAAGDHSLPDGNKIPANYNAAQWATKQTSLKRFLSQPLLSRLSKKSTPDSLACQLHYLKQLYDPNEGQENSQDTHRLHLLDNAVLEDAISAVCGKQESLLLSDIEEKVESLDSEMVLRAGGLGSLSKLCPSQYDAARKRIICVFLHHCDLVRNKNQAELESVWRASLKIMEDGLRNALSCVQETRTTKEVCMRQCELHDQISSFLLSLESHMDKGVIVEYAVREFSAFFSLITDDSDLKYLESAMEAASRRALLRLISLKEVVGLLDDTAGHTVVDSPVAMESLTIGLSRLLGRGQSDAGARISKQNESRAGSADTHDLGGHYSAGLSGSDCRIRIAVRDNVHRLFNTLGRVAEKALSRRTSNSSPESVVSVDSLILSLLAVFTSTLKHDDVDKVILGSGILEILPKVLLSHRKAILHDRSSINEDGISVVKELQAICQREISRSILRAAVAAAHALIYQAASPSKVQTNFIGSDAETKTMPVCLDFLRDELAHTFPLLENAVVEAAGGIIQKRANADWEKWCEIGPVECVTAQAKKKESRHQVGSSGLKYLVERGASHTTAVQASSQKASSRQKGNVVPASRSGLDDMARLQSSFSHQFLSHWLHVLSGVVKSPLAVNMVSRDAAWMKILLKAVGLSVAQDSTGRVTHVTMREHDHGLLPGRFRSRILRLLLHLLHSVEPCEPIVRGLFNLAGAASPAVAKCLDEDESFVSREAVSLLRHLHCPTRSDWRACVNGAIGRILASKEDDLPSFLSRIGVLAFFSGNLEIIGRGSYVLLKPAAAVPLSVDQQGSPSSKGHSSGIGGGSGSGIGATPHHVVGNGTEGIVAGLCRYDASAGIVSSIDMKNGICEVILLNRDELESGGSDGGFERSLRAKATISGSKNSTMSRHTLTVRALRTPLSDVVQAQEVPLYLDEAVPVDELTGAMFRSSLNSLFSSVNPSVDIEEEKFAAGDLPSGSEEHGNKKSGVEGLRSGILNLSVSLMTLRSVIVVLSDERILSSFLQKPSRESLALVLNLAWPAETESADISDFVRVAQRKYLSSLPVHEARYCHLVSLLRDLSFRSDVLGETTESQWTSRFSELVARRVEEAETKDAASGGAAEGYRTPPVDSGSGPGIPPVLGSSNTAHADMDSSARNADSSSNRAVSQSTMGSNSEDDEDSEAAATAAAHLREAAIAQMAELGLPRSWSELALRRTGGTNIEAAVHFCLERGGEMERLLAEERERERLMQRQSSSSQSSRRRGNRGESGTSNHLLRQLLEMGFPSRWCAEALAATGNNVDEALTWILTNGERLSEEEEALEEDGDGDEVDEDEDESLEDEDEEDAGESGTEPSSSVRRLGRSEDTIEKETADPDTKADDNSVSHKGWSNSVVPLRFISGRSIIDPKSLAISGLPTGGFSSVGTKGILLSSGKWYYEAILETAGCLQIGWADGSFAGHCHADRGDGCGDGPSSWAYDGWRRYRWHSTATEWGCRWKEGDVVGCLVDMDDHVVSFTLNGRAEEIGMGVAFAGEGFRPCGGVYACVSFNRREKLRLILGGNGSESFKYEPPRGYRGVGEAVLNAVKERDLLVSKEKVLDRNPDQERQDAKRFLCDFSDGEHGHELMAWAHRYYGSDASVHLGSGRSKQSSGIPKGPNNSAADSSSTSCISQRVEKAWGSSNDEGQVPPIDEKTDHGRIVSLIKKGYEEIAQKVIFQLFNESIVMALLFARKLILHLIVTMGNKFDIKCFLMNGSDEVNTARLFWMVLETCGSLRCAGWVGEAGAMAIAAEALGLGISSNEHSHSRQNMSERSAISSISDLDDGVFLPSGGITQLLSSILIKKMASSSRETGISLAGAAEAAFGSDGGGGVLVFLQQGLQSAVCKSEALQSVLVAAVRRSVRLLAVVEYEGDDSDTPELQEDENESERVPSSLDKRAPANKEDDNDDQDVTTLPDARLGSFLTGLLMSKPVQEAVADHTTIQRQLFQAWSIGLLSASLPWRMVCAFTAAGLLNMCPQALSYALESLPTLSKFFGRLESTVARRVWAERAAVPVCSRYVQAMIELLSSVKRAVPKCTLPCEFTKFWGNVTVDAATPLPLKYVSKSSPEHVSSYWESDDGWVSSDNGWEVWTGTIEYMAVDWKTPTRSAVRTLMDGGEGPPMLREGCFVMRGLDWEDGGTDSKRGNEDGKDLYEAEKAKREKEKRRVEEQTKEEADSGDSNAPRQEEDTNLTSQESVADVCQSSDPTDEVENHDPVDATNHVLSASEDGASNQQDAAKKKKKKKVPSPKLPLGTVVSIEPWNSIPGMGRKVKWNLTGAEAVYRYGGDGGRYDISHVEVNEKGTRVKKRHPLPESAEQCAARHGFGAGRRYCVLLRLRQSGNKNIVDGEEEHYREGILECPDFGAGIRVSCTLHSDGAMTMVEKELVYGSKDSGWEARFGQPSFVSGTEVVLSPTKSSSTTRQADLDTRSSFLSLYEELLGSTTFDVKTLRNREDGSSLRVTSEIRLFRGRRRQNLGSRFRDSIEAPLPPPLHFDRDYHASSLSLSRDGRTVSCIASDGRGTAFGSVGFTKGVHYWEVKLEQADIGSVFIGVAEKPGGSGSGSSYGYDSPPRLNRWHGWGFVNFRATYTSGAERVYGAHCHAGDTVGVLLDCDAGRISFFFDGLKYGEHILNDLGCAFENLSPFGFNVDGCGSGGAGQGAPSGIEGGRGGRYPAQGSVRPRALWPVVGLRNQGDRVTISPKWMTSYGVDGVTTVDNVLAVDEVLFNYSEKASLPASLGDTKHLFPEWFIKEAFTEYQRWHSGSWFRSITRGSGPYRLASFGLDVELDASPIACACASAGLGLNCVLLAGDRVRLVRSAGRLLELAEEAVVLGAYQGRLFYRIMSQKSEGGSLTEGGGRAWCWDESEVVDGLPFVSEGKAQGIELPMLDRFKCLSSGGLKIVFDGGAVVRSDLEIFDGSLHLGTIPVNTIIPQEDVLERRVNSCGVVRYRVRFEGIGKGWISARLRGGKEECIVEPVYSDDDDSVLIGKDSFQTPLDCALAWYDEYQKIQKRTSFDDPFHDSMEVSDIEEFKKLLVKGIVSGLSVVESDSLLAAAVGSISNFSESGDAVDCTFYDIAHALSFAISSKNSKVVEIQRGSAAANQAAATVFASIGSEMPSLKAVMARVALIRTLNRRARLALPWLSVRPCQEGSAIMGGLCGHGASTERTGRNKSHKSHSQWVQLPSIASRIRTLRGLFFTSVKRGLLQSITEATATPTPLSHDEYELPREIRTVRINRLKARRVMAGNDMGAKRKYSVFAQLHNETKGWGGAALRRGYVAKGHGGQRRAFKVKLIGEGVNDYSGPYREAFTDAMSEVLDVQKSSGTLGVLDPTPNKSSQIGENRELYMFSSNGRDLSNLPSLVSIGISEGERSTRQSFSSLIAARDESSREVEEALVFLGRLTGTAYRHGIPVDLPLPLHCVWKALVEQVSSDKDRLQELDYLAYKQWEEEKSEDIPILCWQQRMLNSFVEGLSNVLPVEVLTILTGEELRDALCGNPDVDVDLLRRVVEYEGYEESDSVIEHFWETLRELSNDERKVFLQFVWARNRLPLKESDFEAPFKIQRDSINTNERADQALPSASTCFFSLTLPEYTSKEILKEKLLFAINNVTTMETDFQTNSAEIAEGYRAF